MTKLANKTATGTRQPDGVEMKLLSIPFCVILLLTMIGCADTGPAQISEIDLRTTAETIHDAVITIDSHDDIPFDFATESVDPLNGVRQVNLEKMRVGGLNVCGSNRTDAGELRASENRCNDEVRCDPPHGGRDVSGSHRVGLLR